MNREKPDNLGNKKPEKPSTEKEEDLKRQVKELNEKLEEAQKIIEKKRIETKRVRFVEKYFENLYGGRITEFKNRMMQAKETNEQLVKDLVYITYNTIDLANFISNGWKADTYNEGNVERIFQGGEINPEHVKKYSSENSSAYVNMIINFLGLNYKIDHIDHLIGGYDINDKLKKMKEEGM